MGDSAGFYGLNGAAEKRAHHRVILYFSQILSPKRSFGNPQCIPNCIPIAPVELTQRVARLVPSNIAGEYPFMNL